MGKEVGFFEILMDSTPDLVFYKDLNGVYLDCNKAFANHVGLTREEVKGKTDYDFYAPEDAEYERSNDEKMLKGTKPRKNEDWITNADGSELLIETLKAPVFSPDGDLIGVLGLSRDITHRKETEDTLKEDNIQLQLLNALVLEQLRETEYNSLINLLLVQLEKNTKAAVIIFSEYSLQNKCLITRKFKSDNKILNVFNRVSGKKISGFTTPVNDVLYKEIVSSKVGYRSSISEITQGAVSPRVSKTIQKITGLKKFIGLAHVIDDRLFGVSLLAFQEEEPGVNNKFLESFANISAISLKRFQAEGDLKKRLLIEKAIADISSIFVNYTHEKIDNCIDKALSVAAKTFGIDRANVFVMSEDGEKLSISNEWYNQGVKPIKEIMQNCPAKSCKWLICRLESFNPVVISSLTELPEDAEQERDALTRCGTKSLLAVPIIARDKLYGHISFDSVNSERNWTADEVTLLKIFSEIVSNSILRNRSEEEIKSLLREKEILLKETHHRIKNNMNTVKGLLLLQAYKQEEQSNRSILEDAASRMQSMSILYEKLYQTKDYDQIETEAYFTELIEEIFEIFPQSKDISKKVEIENFKLPSKIISNLGIIINECITNSLKHAFQKISDPMIRVSLKNNAGFIELTISDNGIGFSEKSQCDDRLGLQVIRMIVNQLKGNLRIIHDKGTAVEIDFFNFY